MGLSPSPDSSTRCTSSRDDLRCGTAQVVRVSAVKPQALARQVVPQEMLFTHPRTSRTRLPAARHQTCQPKPPLLIPPPTLRLGARLELDLH
eukprot:scaffold133183_cov30-Tisochrysis_lutea.AAC.2